MAIQYLNGVNISGDVGIGTTNPQKPLDVNGEVLLRDHLFIGGYGENDSTNSIEIGRNRTGDGICFFDMTTDNTTYTDYGFRLIRFSGVNPNTELIHRGTGDFRIKGQEASTMTFYTGNSARMRIDSSGNVGIGTTSPSSKLDVNGTGAFGTGSAYALKLKSSSGARGIEISDSNGVDRGGIDWSGSDFAIRNASDNDLLKINYSSKQVNLYGNVGIGTTSPTSKLTINGDTRLSNGGKLYLWNDHSSNYLDYRTWVASSSAGMTIQNSATDGDILLLPNGNVGIGTASPSRELHIANSGDPKILIEDTSGDNQVGVIYKTTNYEWTAGLHGGEDAFKISNGSSFGTNDYFTVINSGNVGIGTTSPDAKLRVNYDENTGTAFKVTGGGSGEPIASFVRDIGGSGTVNIHASNSYPQINFQNTSTTFSAGAAGTQFRISHSSSINTNTLLAVGSGGNVGIGTTSPSARLHVADPSNPTILIEDTVDSNQVRTTYKNTDFTMVTGLHGTQKVYRIMAGDDFNTTANRIANFDGNNLRVSIGNVTPARKLHVRTDSNIVARFDTTTASTGALISFVNSTSTNDNQVKLGADPGDGNKLSLWGSNIKTMTLSGGNVGIGTTTPVGKLSVYRTDTTYAVNLSDARSRSSLYLKGSGNFDSELTFSSGSSSVQLIQAVNSAATAGRDIAINPFGGNVGIGTTSPSDTLEIASANQQLRLTDTDDSKYAQFSYSGGKLTVRNNSTTTSANQITLQENGNVGIGTTSPQAKLHVANGTLRTWSPASGTSAIFESTVNSRNFLTLTAANEAEIWFADASAQNRGRIRYELNTNSMEFWTNGGQKMVINSTGNVGIGTTSPGSKLQVVGAATATSFKVGSSGTMELFDYSGNLHVYSTAGTDILLGGGIGNRQNNVTIGNGNLNVVGKITADNFVSVQGIDTGNPSASSEELRLSGYGILGNRSAFYITNGNATGTIRFGIGGSVGNHGSNTKMLLNNSGNLGIGTTSPGSKLDLLGATNATNSSLLRLRSTSTSPNAPEKVAAFYYNSNTERGYIAVNQYAVLYSTSSDYRLKENVVPISNGIERVKELNPCRFNFIGANTDNVVDGFMAHEAAEVVPESVAGERDAVDENNEPIYQGIDQSKIVPLLTAALKEAIEKIEQLENRIQTLENI